MEAADEAGFHGSPEGGNALANPRIAEFLGRANVLLVRGIAGKQAGLLEFNRIVKRRDAVAQVHRTDPNAAALWATRKDRRADRKTPGEILAQAREAFHQIGPGGARKDREWDMFLQLDPGVVRNHARETGSLAEICGIAVDAGQVPPPGVLEELLSHGKKYAKLPRAMLAALLRECAGREPPPATREQLRRVLVHAARVPMGVPAQGGAEGRPDRRTWAQWMDRTPLPRAARPRGNGKQDGGADGRADGRDVGNTDHPQEGTAARAARILSGVDPETMEEAVRAAGSAVQVTGEDRRAAVTVRDHQGVREALSFERLDSGAVAMRAPEAWTGPGVRLKREAGQKRQRPEITMGPFASLTALRSIERAIREGCERRGDPAAGDQEALMRAAWELLSGLAPEDRTQADDVRMNLELQNALETVLDPGVMRRAEEEIQASREPAWVNMKHREMTLNHYNLTAAGPELARELGKTNPGALRWMFAFCDVDEEIRHPGQVIAEARRSMTANGLGPHAWKYAASLPENICRIVLSGLGPETAAAMLSAMADSGKAPGEEAATRIKDDLIKTTVILHAGDAGAARNPALRDNVVSAVTLALRGGGGHPGAVRPKQQVSDVADYIRSISRQDRRTASTTWNGLLKASERWHREQQAELARFRRENLAKRRGGRMLTWDSLLGEHEAMGFTVVPLTGELQLIEESETMLHCVADYAPQCVSGLSRLFSIRKNGCTQATAQIERGREPDSHTWRAAQTRGYRNRPAGGELLQVTRMIAERYGEACRQAEGAHPAGERAPGAAPG